MEGGGKIPTYWQP